MRPSHPAGVVAMRKAPLDQRASLPEQALAIGPVHPLPVGVDGPLLLLLALPVPLPPLLLLRNIRSEEHTSELQSQFHLVCRLLLEKKKLITIHLSRYSLSFMFI